MRGDPAGPDPTHGEGFRLAGGGLAEWIAARLGARSPSQRVVAFATRFVQHLEDRWVGRGRDPDPAQVGRDLQSLDALPHAIGVADPMRLVPVDGAAQAADEAGGGAGGAEPRAAWCSAA